MSPSDAEVLSKVFAIFKLRPCHQMAASATWVRFIIAEQIVVSAFCRRIITSHQRGYDHTITLPLRYALLFIHVFKPYKALRFTGCIFNEPLFPLAVKVTYLIIQLRLADCVRFNAARKILYVLRIRLKRRL